MPGMGGLELLRRLREMESRVPVIVVSGHVDIPQVVQSMSLGAIDLLQKPFRPDELVALVRRAIEASIHSGALGTKQEEARQRFATLTPRELELAKLVVAGHSSKQIAAMLGLSTKTVENHRAHLMKKTGAMNTADLARFSTIAGIDPPRNPLTPG